MPNTFTHWKIKDDRIHVIVHDNASNMVKAFDDGNLTSTGCFAHTLQLILKQDKPTRWNSSFCMLQRIKEQKMAIAEY